MTYVKIKQFQVVEYDDDVEHSSTIFIIDEYGNLFYKSFHRYAEIVDSPLVNITPKEVTTPTHQ